ncbi:hypothetical protein BDN70DRAFT_503799 [Pholiota conissans]|uniref:Gustatory receptor n=1 Tax=Pholiota conissans TaxID=109636 RepID=A0A9P5YNL1_9AGAR|nr:hypothetical protein BDN70DRAFT_503799 [Pholiota conissans]
MKIPHIPSRITLFFTFTALITLGHARIPTHSTKKAFQLILTPIHTATFAFYIIFGLFTAFQTLSALIKAITALRSIGHRNKKAAEEGLDFSTGSIYAYIIFLAASSALAYYVLSAVWVVYTLNDFAVKPITDAFAAGRTIADDLSDFFICFAMIALIYHRQRVGFGAVSVDLRPFTYKAIVDGLLLIAFLAVMIVYTCLRAVYSDNTTVSHLVEAANQLLTIQRVEISLFFVLAVNIAASSAWTWIKLKKVSQADTAILGHIVKFVSPMLIIRAIYRVVRYVLYDSKNTVTLQQSDAFRLARVIVLGVTYFVILLFSMN